MRSCLIPKIRAGGGGGRLLRCLLRNHMRKWRASIDYFDFWGSIYFSEAGGKIRDQRCRCEHRVIPKSDWHNGKEKGLALTHTAKVKKKRENFQERKYLTKMQRWIIQYVMWAHRFSEKSCTLRVWLRACECVWWGAGEGYVLVGSSSWGGGGRREGKEEREAETWLGLDHPGV